jgi:hypothetical protein
VKQELHTNFGTLIILQLCSCFSGAEFVFLKILMKISLQNEKKTSTKIGSFIVVIVIGIEFTNRFTIR